MTTDDGFDLLLTDWLRAEASEQEPPGFHSGVVALAGHARQRPRWMRAVGISVPVQRSGAQVSGRRMAVLLVVLALLVGLLAAVLGGAPRVAPLARNGSIVFAGGASGPGPVHLVSADGASDVVIGEGRCPTFSADGSVLARWTGTSSRPSSVQAGTVTLTAPDGGTPRTLTGVMENPYDHSLALSPDGTQLAWLRPTGTTWDSTRELWVSPVSGGTGRSIGPATLPSGVLYHPSWSPDGRWVAVLLHDTYRTAIYVVDVQGGDGHVVTTRPGPAGVNDMAWSPDGRSIAFVGVPDEAMPPPPITSGSQAPAMDLFVVGVDGHGERNLTRSPEDESTPRWAPDGRRLAFLKDYATLEILDTESDGDPVPVDATGTDGFTWSPDGTQILAYSAASTTASTTIRSIPLNDRTSWSVHNPGSLTCDPSWQAVSDHPSGGSGSGAISP